VKRRWATWLGTLASVCAGLYFIRAVASNWHSFTLGPAGPHLFLLVGGALLLYLATYTAATRAWQLGLQLMGEARRFAGLLRILMLSQFAKYLPGNIGHHVGRVLLAQRAGLPMDIVVASMLLDMLLMVLAGVACSVPAFALLVEAAREHGATAQRAAWLVLAVLAVAACALVALPAMRRRIAPPLARLAAIRSASGLSRMTQAWASHCASFLLGASALYLLCRIQPQAVLPSPGWLDVVGIYATAWLLGFLMPGAPAGLGVRELVLLLGLSPLLGEQAALTAAAALRLVTTVGDGVAFGAGAWLRRFDESAGRQPAPSGR
jgi:uncharacterized membrane protein YbhN (UPF0104 family)